MRILWQEPEKPVAGTSGTGPVVNNTVITIKNILRAEINYHYIGEVGNRVILEIKL